MPLSTFHACYRLNLLHEDVAPVTVQLGHVVGHVANMDDCIVQTFKRGSDLIVLVVLLTLLSLPLDPGQTDGVVIAHVSEHDDGGIPVVSRGWGPQYL